MCIIRDFIYDSGVKKLQYGDMSWEQYTRYFERPEEVIHEVLTEFQEMPDMSSDDLSLFVTTCLTDITGGTSMRKGEEKPMTPEHHIPMGYLMRELHQQYSEIMAMPARVVFLFLEDLAIFAGQTEYDPDRRSKSVDREGIKKIFGKTRGAVK